MKEDAIIALGREALARPRDDAVIVTWATNPCMPAAVHVVEALGLTPQSMGTWVKDRSRHGPLNMRSRTEHYIIATRGSPTHTLNEVSSWLGDRPLVKASTVSSRRSPRADREALRGAVPRAVCTRGAQELGVLGR
jgi:N6-adenosine-specific RNA methylase IME4